MSSKEILISVKNLSKKYRIYDRPIDRLKEFFYPNVQRFLKTEVRKYYKEYEALNKLSFDVERGSSVGVIGKNGSGKSTLLHLLCGTLTPSSGKIEIKGRVAALLELGSGFNPEFTGRENIFMSASILGLSRKEINEKFSDIANFADIGEFIDRPVKTYSSGMYVRLAFSVIVNVEADILIVDEALSVGDTLFQAKCMKKINQLKLNGISIFFVSHDIAAVKAVCDKAILLDNGQFIKFGKVDVIADDYLRLLNKVAISTNLNTDSNLQVEQKIFKDFASIERIGNGKATVTNFAINDFSGKLSNVFNQGDSAFIKVSIRINCDVDYFGFSYHLRDLKGIDIAYLDSIMCNRNIHKAKKNEVYSLNFRIPLNLMQGEYNIAFSIGVIDLIEDQYVLSTSQFSVADFIGIAGQFSIINGKTMHGYVNLGCFDDVIFKKIK